MERLQKLSRDRSEDAISTGSSRTSTPEMERKNSVIRRNVPESPQSKVQIEFLQKHRQNQQRREPPANSESIASQQRYSDSTVPSHPQAHNDYHQMHRQQQAVQKEPIQLQATDNKPPVPPRGAPPPIPVRSPIMENVPHRRNGIATE